MPKKTIRVPCPKCKAVKEVIDSGERPAIQYKNQSRALTIRIQCETCGHEWDYTLT